MGLGEGLEVSRLDPLTVNVLDPVNQAREMVQHVFEVFLRGTEGRLERDRQQVVMVVPAARFLANLP